MKVIFFKKVFDYVKLSYILDTFRQRGFLTWKYNKLCIKLEIDKNYLT